VLTAELPDLVFDLFRSVKLSEIADLCPRVPKSDLVPELLNKQMLDETGLTGTDEETLSDNYDLTRRPRNEDTSVERALHARDQSADSKQQRKPSQLQLQKTNSDQKLPSELKFIEGKYLLC
jgi:hypothetical protein